MHNRTLYQQHRDYLQLRFALFLPSLPINYNLIPFRLLLGTLELRFHLPGLHRPDPNRDFAGCNNTPARTMTTGADLQLADNIIESTSLDWLELWNALASSHTCIIVYNLSIAPGKQLPTRVHNSEHGLSFSATCCSVPSYNRELAAITLKFRCFFLLLLPNLTVHFQQIMWNELSVSRTFWTTRGAYLVHPSSSRRWQSSFVTCGGNVIYLAAVARSSWNWGIRKDNPQATGSAPPKGLRSSAAPPRMTCSANHK